MFEWDEPKRIANIRKHAIDFRAVAQDRQGLRVHGPSAYPDEPRMLAIGVIKGRIVTVVYTLRGGAIRIISARRARDAEEKAYHARVGRPGPETSG